MLQIIINETILKEGKEDFLKNQYITTDKQVDTSMLNEIDEETFNKIYSADPFNGKYVAWLLNLYKYKQLKLEDLYKAEDYLKLFDKVKSWLPNKDLLARNGKDYVYPSLASLYKAIQPFEEYKSNSKLKREVKKNESKRVYEDDTLIVIAPLTENAACYYGSGTQWCTTSNKNNQFENYNEFGQLYIIINKKEKRKYQFHQNEEQLMDETDSPVNWDDIVDDLYQLISIFNKIIKGYYIFEYNYNYGTFKDKDMIIKPLYQKIYYDMNDNFHVQLGEKYGLININGNIILDVKYDRISLNKNYNYETKIGQQRFVFDKNGKLIE